MKRSIALAVLISLLSITALAEEPVVLKEATLIKLEFLVFRNLPPTFLVSGTLVDQFGWVYKDSVILLPWQLLEITYTPLAFIQSEKANGEWIAGQQCVLTDYPRALLFALLSSILSEYPWEKE